RELLLAAGKKSPMAILKSAEDFTGQSYAKELISDACNKVFTDKKQLLKILQHINDLHDRPANAQFAILPFLTSSQKYDLITQGREEMYTSTYLTFADSLLADLKKKNQSLDMLLSPQQMQRIDVYLGAAASYNRIDQVINSISDKALPNILHNVVAECSSGANRMESAVTLAAIITAHPTNKMLRVAIENELRKGYDKGIAN